MKIPVNDFNEISFDDVCEAVQKDLLFVYNHPKMYINEKKYLTELIDILFHVGYYDTGTNKSLFKEIS